MTTFDDMRMMHGLMGLCLDRNRTDIDVRLITLGLASRALHRSGDRISPTADGLAVAQTAAGRFSTSLGWSLNLTAIPDGGLENLAVALDQEMARRLRR